MTTTLISSFDNESITEVMGYEVLTTAAACRSCKNCEISVPATSTITLHRDELKREVSIFLKLKCKSWLCQKKKSNRDYQCRVFSSAEFLCGWQIVLLHNFLFGRFSQCGWETVFVQFVGVAVVPYSIHK
jgi:hypothetical protein